MAKQEKKEQLYVKD